MSSYVTGLTNAQLQTARDSAVKLQQMLQQFAQGTITETTAYADFSTELNTLADALATAVKSTLVTNGEELTGVTPSGTYTSKVTFTVAAGAITAIALS